MKSIRSNILYLLLALLLATGCKKDTTKKDESFVCTSCVAAPEAKAANDGNSKGIYKGIIIGSTGTIKFDIQNGSTSIKATITIDGVTAELTSSSNWVEGRPFTGVFTGRLGGQDVSIEFSVSSNGTEPIIYSATIPGHTNVQFVIIKENSASLVECFEGTYETTKPETGTFNLILSRKLKLWGGIHRKTGDRNTESMSGTISSDGKLLEDGTDYVGTLKDDQINGSFKDGGGNTVTTKGKRTL